MDGGQRNCIRLECPSFKTSPGSGCFLSWPLPPDQVTELMKDHFYGRLPKQLKVMVAYLKVGPQVRTYSDYLRATWEAKKEDSMELPLGPRTQTTNNLSKPRATSFFPLRKLKSNQPIPKTPAMHLAPLEEEDASDSVDQESDNPSRIKGVMEQFMVHLTRAVKDTQADEKCCYHCGSPEHFIHNCPLVKTLRENKQLNGKGQLQRREPRHLWQQPTHWRVPSQRFLRC